MFPMQVDMGARNGLRMHFSLWYKNSLSRPDKSHFTSSEPTLTPNFLKWQLSLSPTSRSEAGIGLSVAGRFFSIHQLATRGKYHRHKKIFSRNSMFHPGPLRSRILPSCGLASLVARSTNSHQRTATGREEAERLMARLVGSWGQT